MLWNLHTWCTTVFAWNHLFKGNMWVWLLHWKAVVWCLSTTSLQTWPETWPCQIVHWNAPAAYRKLVHSDSEWDQTHQDNADMCTADDSADLTVLPNEQNSLTQWVTCVLAVCWQTKWYMWNRQNCQSHAPIWSISHLRSSINPSTNWTVVICTWVQILYQPVNTSHGISLEAENCCNPQQQAQQLPSPQPGVAHVTAVSVIDQAGAQLNMQRPASGQWGQRQALQQPAQMVQWGWAHEFCQLVQSQISWCRMVNWAGVNRDFTLPHSFWKMPFQVQMHHAQVRTEHISLWLFWHSRVCEKKHSKRSKKCVPDYIDVSCSYAIWGIVSNSQWHVLTKHFRTKLNPWGK